MAEKNSFKQNVGMPNGMLNSCSAIVLTILRFEAQVTGPHPGNDINMYKDGTHV